MKIETARAAVSIHSMVGTQKVSADARRIYHRAGSAVGRVGEDTTRAERVAQCAAAADIRFERVVGKIHNISAQERGCTQRAHLAPRSGRPTKYARSGALEISDCAVEL